MQPLSQLISAYAQPGQLEWIGVRSARRAPMMALDFVEALAAGTGGALAGDHASPGKRGLTLVQAEHLPVIGSFMGTEPVPADKLRRNLVVAGLNLSALKGRRLRIGTAVIEITGICAPCSRMEETLGHGGYAAVRGHGGWCARLIEPGAMSLGDPVTPVPSA